MKYRNFRSKFIPDYAVIQYLLCALGLCTTYWLTRLINFILRGGPENYLDITTSLDRAIPVIPVWTVMYFISYVFWIISYLWVSKESREMSNRLLTADMLGKIICTAVFLIVPTTAARPTVPTDAFAAPLLELLYVLDSPDNLFPSMHCSVSWFAMRYVLKCRKIPKWYKITSVISTLAVFASVLFTKQHVIIDIFGGIAVAELSIQLSDRTGLHKLHDKLDVGKFYERKHDKHD